MNTLFLLIGSVLLCVVQSSAQFDEIIDSINSMDTTWKAGRNFPDDTPKSHLKSLLGVNKKTAIRFILSPLIHMGVKNLPEFFDARENWPYCPTIQQIQDQGSCGSCWAVATSEAITDRICIHSKGKNTVRISAQDLTSCCQACGRGCYGGMPSMAWLYWVVEGIVSGGSYDSDQGCRPYEVPPCEHHTNGSYAECIKGLETPTCSNRCTNQLYGESYYRDRHYGAVAYSVPNDEEQIRIEIMKNGPVTTHLRVYEDFFHYKSGIYQYVQGGFSGRHAVKLIGWGVENEVPYWLIANSWNEDWGDSGYFKILRGINHLSIEDGVVAGLPNM